MDEVDIEDLPEGRISGIPIRVIRVSEYTKERREDELTVEMLDGSALQLIIWSKHDINWEWARNGWYRLYNVRHKIWETNGEQRHELSSTDDMSIDTIVSSEDSKGIELGSAGPAGPNRAIENDQSKEDLVDRLLDDLDFEAES